MATRSNASSSTVVMAIILIITFPIWFAVGGTLFGVMIGVFGALFGAAVGVAAAIFGVIVTLITLPFKIVFGWGHWGWHGFPHFHGGFWLITLIVIAALIARGRKTA